MGTKTILVLLMLVAGLGVTLWLTSETPPVEERAETLALDGRSLRVSKRMRWQFFNEAPHEVERGEDGVFRLSEPIQDRASMGFMRQIVQAWDSANLQATEFPDDENGQRETGLDEPRLTFLAEWPDGHRIEYDIGAPGPLGEDRFLRRDGKIWRGGAGLYESMRVNLDDLRDRQVFAQREVVCSELGVTYAAATGKRETLRLKRDGGPWRMIEPVESRAQPAAAVRFVTAVLSLRVDSFMAGMVRLPERDPDVVVTAIGSLGTEKLEMWTELGAAFGRLPGRTGWFQIDPRTFESAFANAAAHLRARTLIGLDDIASELAEVAVDPGQGRGDRTRLLRDSVGVDWRLIEPTAFPVNATRANELVQAINNLRAVEFADGKTVDDPALGLGPGRLAVSLRGFEAREVTTLWLGATVQRGDFELVYACRADEAGTVVLVPGAAVERLRRQWVAYCARQVVQIMVPIERLEISKSDGSGARVYKLDSGHWIEEGKPDHLDEVGEFVSNDLRDLVAKNAIDLRGGRLGDPDWVVKMCRLNGDALQTLRAWDRGGELPVVLQPQREQDVGFEVGVRDSKQLRELWR